MMKKEQLKWTMMKKEWKMMTDILEDDVENSIFGSHYIPLYYDD